MDSDRFKCGRLEKCISAMSDGDLEQRLCDLQEEFQALQEQAAEVEQRQERRVGELEAALHKLQQQNDVLVLEKLGMQVQYRPSC